MSPPVALTLANKQENLRWASERGSPVATSNPSAMNGWGARNRGETEEVELMKRKSKRWLPIALMGCGILAACSATPHTHGVVAMVIDNRLAHVCIGGDEVHPGDRVVVTRHECIDTSVRGGKTGAGRRPVCARKPIGSGVVTKRINDHFSEVRFDNELSAKKGDQVKLEEPSSR